MYMALMCEHKGKGNSKVQALIKIYLYTCDNFGILNIFEFGFQPATHVSTYTLDA